MQQPKRSGRHRRFNPSIPSHIDQTKLPTGVYWDNSGHGRWYLQTGGPDEKLHNRRVAGPAATISDLHRIAEEYSGVHRDRFVWLCDQFERSTQFLSLAEATQKDYRYCRSVVSGLKSRSGEPLGETELRRWNSPSVQKLIDQIAKDGTPSKANHVLRYLRRLFRWGKARGYIQHLPTEAVEQAKERKLRRLPDDAAYLSLLGFARSSGQLPSNHPGSHPDYLWPVMEIAYLCRLRGIEVITLSDANIRHDGVMTNRRKGSRDNLVSWSNRLRQAIDAATALRAAIYRKRGLNEPNNPEQLFLFVSDDGGPLRRSTLDTAWQRMITDAITQGVISADQRFSLHDLKRKGITDTHGTRADKQLASGHRSEAMLDVYDLSIPIVDPSATD